MKMPMYYWSKTETTCSRYSSISHRQNLRYLTATLLSPSTSMGVLTISIEFGLRVRNMA